MLQISPLANIDEKTVQAFGNQWTHYHQGDADREELKILFERYFSLVEWDKLPAHAQGFDAGCGTGRWAVLASERLGHLHCIDASAEALEVAKRNLSHISHCSFHNCSIEAAPIRESSLDFGYSLGVLHHMPHTQRALDDCVKYLKPGAPFLLYLYYNFDNQPAHYHTLWKVSELIRKAVTALPVRLRNGVCAMIAALLYWPFAKLSRLGEKAGCDVASWPLSDYRNATFYRMRHNARDRFGTELEQRFSKAEIKEMMTRAGLENIRFREEGAPFWVAIGTRKKPQKKRIGFLPFLKK